MLKPKLESLKTAIQAHQADPGNRAKLEAIVSALLSLKLALMQECIAAHRIAVDTATLLRDLQNRLFALLQDEIFPATVPLQTKLDIINALVNCDTLLNNPRRDDQLTILRQELYDFGKQLASEAPATSVSSLPQQKRQATRYLMVAALLLLITIALALLAAPTLLGLSLPGLASIGFASFAAITVSLAGVCLKAALERTDFKTAVYSLFFRTPATPSAAASLTGSSSPAGIRRSLNRPTGGAEILTGYDIASEPTETSALVPK